MGRTGVLVILSGAPSRQLSHGRGSKGARLEFKSCVAHDLFENVCRRCLRLFVPSFDVGSCTVAGPFGYRNSGNLAVPHKEVTARCFGVFVYGLHELQIEKTRVGFGRTELSFDATEQ